MPDQLDDHQWVELLRDRDTFRVAIRGFAAIEADVDTFIEEAFESPVPGGIRGLGGFERRLLIAVALGIVPTTFVNPIKALARVRNDFAHRLIEEISDQRLGELRQAYALAMPESAESLRTLSPPDVLRFTLFATRLIVRGQAAALRPRREEIKRHAEQEAFRQAILRRIEQIRGDD
ncbi:MAG TPA: hypothetical protein VFA66_11145 [Gaiellaceae bacterium]|nr:hypothetical protein [Gaiellaceae bacterium]